MKSSTLVRLRNPPLHFCFTFRILIPDPDIVTTIVTNLIGNSMKYTPRGEIRISCRAVVENGIRYSEVAVADTGYGISKEALPRIFDRYYQANGSHQASGTGIGLALVKNLAEIHQAILSVESEENVGSTFRIRFLSDIVGFSGYPAFAKAFKREYEMTASEYAARHRSFEKA